MVRLGQPGGRRYEPTWKTYAHNSATEIFADAKIEGLARLPDRGYRGPNAPPTHRFWLFIPDQRRRVAGHRKREPIRRRDDGDETLAEIRRG